MTIKKEVKQLSSFGQMLKTARERRCVSQMNLAALAGSTPRYISFIETGKSRPSREVVERLVCALELSHSDKNALLISAGLPTEYSETEQNESESEVLELAVQVMLDNHSPYPACAGDALSRILFTNSAFRRFFPGLANRTAEESIDDFFGPEGMRNSIENWAEIAWMLIDRRKIEAARSNNPEVSHLSDRAVRHMQGVDRPASTGVEDSTFLYPKFTIAGQRVSTYVTVMKYEYVKNATLGDLRLTFFYPSDSDADQFFRSVEPESYPD